MLEVILLIAAVVIGLAVVMNMDVTPRATTTTQVVQTEPETTAGSAAHGSKPGPPAPSPAPNPASARPQSDPGESLAA